MSQYTDGFCPLIKGACREDCQWRDDIWCVVKKLRPIERLLEEITSGAAVKIIQMKETLDGISFGIDSIAQNILDPK